MIALRRTIGKVAGQIRAESRQLYNRYFGKIRRFDGDAKQICEQIVEELWEGDFYRTSLGHFDFFFIRDFGTVAESLTRIGRKKHVLHTIRWVLLQYRASGEVTTCIDKAGNCFNAPMHAVDSLPWLLHCILVSNYNMNKAEKTFIEEQLVRYREKYLDTSGHLRPIKMGEMRDAVLYDRSAYAISLIGRMAYCVEQLELTQFPYSLQKYQEELLTRYWNGRYFNPDRVETTFSADGALMPFFLGVIIDSALFTATSEYIIEQKLDKPFPMLYTKDDTAFRYHWWMTKPIMPHYEGHTLWSWHGLFYLHTMKRYADPLFTKQCEAFAKGMIEQHGTFPEMLNADGSWYYSSIYKGDPGMVWAALYVELVS